MKSNRIKISALMSALGAGASFQFAIEGASKRVDFVNDNYLVVKSLGAGALGSGLLYFGKTENEKAAGYALLGVAGASGASKLSTVLVTSDDSGQVNGLPKLQRIKGMLGARRGAPAADRMRGGMFGKMKGGARRLDQGSTLANARPGIAQPGAMDYDALAFSDVIYSM